MVDAELTAARGRRESELAAGWAAAQGRVAEAARAAGRDPCDVRIVAVTKRFPASDIEILARLGVTDVGENRLQEARDKRALLADLDGVAWHFIGQVQTNKAKAVSAIADQVDTVDREGLVKALERGAVAHGRTVGCLVQVSLADDPGAAMNRGGCDPTEALAIADEVAAAAGLQLMGVMGMAPLHGDPARAFDVLAGAAARIRAEHPAATTISAGMSGDLAEAIAAGATQVRLGTAILGQRPAVG